MSFSVPAPVPTSAEGEPVPDDPEDPAPDPADDEDMVILRAMDDSDLENSEGNLRLEVVSAEAVVKVPDSDTSELMLSDLGRIESRSLEEAEAARASAVSDGSAAGSITEEAVPVPVVKEEEEEGIRLPAIRPSKSASANGDLSTLREVCGPGPFSQPKKQ